MVIFHNYVSLPEGIHGISYNPSHFEIETYVSELWALPFCKKCTLDTPFCTYSLRPNLKQDKTYSTEKQRRKQGYKLPSKGDEPPSGMLLMDKIPAPETHGNSIWVT